MNFKKESSTEEFPLRTRKRQQIDYKHDFDSETESQSATSSQPSQKRPSLREEEDFNIYCPTDANEDYCFVCKDEGTLICCSNCTKSFHQSCIQLKEIPRCNFQCSYCVPETDQNCSFCEGVQNTQEPSSQPFKINCTMCYRNIHFACLELELFFLFDTPINLQFLLPEEYLKLVNQYKNEPNLLDFEERFRELSQSTQKLTGQELKLGYVCFSCMQFCGVDKILDYIQITNQEDSDVYLVKFGNASYLHVCWVGEDLLTELSGRKLKAFKERVANNRNLQQTDVENRDEAENYQELQEQLEEYTRIERILECKKSVVRHGQSY